MPRVHLKRFFSQPGILRGIDPENLLALLADHAAALETGGLALPEVGTALGFDYELLTRLMMTPGQLPPALLEAFYFIHQMATPEGMECLLDAAERATPPIEILGNPAPTPGDVAVQVWLKNRELLESVHANESTKRTSRCLRPVQVRQTRLRERKLQRPRLAGVGDDLPCPAGGCRHCGRSWEAIVRSFA